MQTASVNVTIGLLFPEQHGAELAASTLRADGHTVELRTQSDGSVYISATASVEPDALDAALVRARVLAEERGGEFVAHSVP